MADRLRSLVNNWYLYTPTWLRWLDWAPDALHACICRFAGHRRIPSYFGVDWCIGCQVDLPEHKES